MRHLRLSSPIFEATPHYAAIEDDDCHRLMIELSDERLSPRQRRQPRRHYADAAAFDSCRRRHLIAY